MASTPLPLPPYGANMVSTFQATTPGVQHQLGDVYYDDSSRRIMIWDGNRWVALSEPEQEALKEAAEAAVRMGESLAKAKDKKVLKAIIQDPSLIANRPDLTRFDQILEDSHGEKKTT